MAILNLYNTRVLPGLLNREMGLELFNETREKTVAPVFGVVLEVGFGSGYNLPYYKNVKKLYALDPSKELFALSSNRIEKASFEVEHLSCSAETIPLPNDSIDFVVSTWSLCSIPNVPRALNEIKRVLKPGGTFLFVEHGQSPRMFNFILQVICTPFTQTFKGNCHLTRNIDTLIKNSGLSLSNMDMHQEEGAPLYYSYSGVATRKK